MTKRFEISTSQHFSSMGVLGASMFIFSPLFAGACYWSLFAELADTYGGNVWPPVIGLIVSSIAFSAGIVMVIIGREQEHIVREVDPDPTKRLWNT